MPSGITLIAPAFNDRLLHEVGVAFQHATNLPLGATSHKLPPRRPVEVASSGSASVVAVNANNVDIAVCGAHLTGQPLNWQLTSLGGKLLSSTKTASVYRMHHIDRAALGMQGPAVPGLVRVADGKQGAAVEVEVWSLPAHTVGSFIENVKAPLVLGSVELVDGRTVKGFLCESHAADRSRDISSFGGWRAFLASASTQQPKKT